MPPREAIAIAEQIAGALSAAHAAGIVHRDLKPENLFLAKDGQTKVLDFGLAKLVETAPPGSADAANAPTVIGTTLGQVLGTVGYMAPEQAQGQDVDRRADLFAFGCVLHEMLTGARAFDGRTVHQTLDKILSEDPVLPDAVARTLPAQLDWIRTKCLAKEASRRYQGADDLAVDLARAADELAAGRTGQPVATREDSGLFAARPTAWKVLGSPVGLALVLVAGAALVAAALSVGNDPIPANPALERITSFSTVAEAPAVSPNGQMLAFVAKEPQGPDSQVWIKSLPDGPPQQLTNTPGFKTFPAFSPDGSRIAYTAMGDEWQWDTWVVPIVGGEPRLLMRNANSLRWMPRGGLIFSEFKQGIQLAIVTSDESGAERRDLWVPELNQMAHQSEVSPDGRSVIIAYMNPGPLSPEPRACFVRPLAAEGADQIRLIGGGGVPCNMFARWSPDGEWIYFASGPNEIWREPAGGGTPEKVFGGPELDLTFARVFSPFELMPTGESLILTAGQNQWNLWLHAPSGQETQLTFNGDAYGAQFSQDGGTVYYVAAPRGEAGEVWEYRVDDGRRQQVCPGLTVSQLEPSPDGRHLVLQRADDGRRYLWVCRIDGTEPPRRLLDGAVGQRNPLFSPDGSTVYFEQRDRRIWRVGLDGSDARSISSEIAVYALNSVSPDGEWLSVSHQEESPREAWLYPTSGEGDPRFLTRGWSFYWTPGNRSFMFHNNAMISTTWVLENPDGLALPTDLPEHPTSEWFEEVGARRVASEQSFSTPSPSPTSFEFVDARNDIRGNLYRLDLNR